MPFPTLAPSAFSTGTEISWISAPAESLAVPLHGLSILPSSSSRAELQSKALMFPEEALVESSFLLAWEPGLLPVNKSHEKNGLGKPPAGLCPFAENLAGPFC